MISSFNARIKPPTIGGLPLYFVYSFVLAAISLWLSLMLKDALPVRIIMATICLCSIAFGIYVLKNYADWAFLKVKRAAHYEQECPLHHIKY